MKWMPVVLMLAACSSPNTSGDDGVHDATTIDTPDARSAGLPPPVQPGDFSHALDKAYIRSFQAWIDDPGFEVKWATMTTTAIDFLGGADSAFHADLASRTIPLPGGEVQCHGDAKFDNFGWTLVAGTSVFSDNDFDDAGLCPAAADALHYLLATDILFADPTLDDVALQAYVDTIASGAVIVVDPSTEPAWDAVRVAGLAKVTQQSKLILGGEVQVATTAEVTAVTALVASDLRFPTTVLDVTRDVRTTGGSAGLRRFWLLAEDSQHPRTVLELKELSKPGTEFGPHSETFDGNDRFAILKQFWWGAPGPADHFTVDLLGGKFVARNRFTRVNPKPTKLTAPQIKTMIQTEASIMALKHRGAWQGVAPDQLEAWLRESTATMVARWRGAYADDGGS
ncbi:hypothetical protein BH11MYX1_BH11MYX1_25990 [soil metagenome]